VSRRSRTTTDLDTTLWPVTICKSLLTHLRYADSNDDSEDEGIKDYQVGGYHPVHLGEILIGRYVIVQKLGWGQFSTVWLAKDMKYENTFVALKVQKSAPSYKVAAYDEVEILDVIAKNAYNLEWLESLKKYHRGMEEKVGMVDGKFTSQHTQVVQLLNSFMHYGANGDHFIMVFEILGVNLLEIMKRYEYKGIPMPLVRRIAKQVLIGLDYLHRVCKIIHTDLKPENTIVALSNECLSDIVKNGQIVKQRKKYQKQNNLIVESDSAIFIPGGRKAHPHKEKTLLEGKDTKGLTKQQKKKLKRKIKKEMAKNDMDSKSNDGSHHQQMSPEQDKKRSQAVVQQLMALDDNQEELSWQRPRSHSLPNLMRQDDENDSEYINVWKARGEPSYVFKIERNFGYEVQDYLKMKRELNNRRVKLLSG
jgi:serine/threonine-protein kinase SRPK3